jgi:hypothetical protein
VQMGCFFDAVIIPTNRSCRRFCVVCKYARRPDVWRKNGVAGRKAQVLRLVCPHESRFL